MVATRAPTGRGPTVQQALRRHAKAYLASHTPDPLQGLVLRRLQACRTAALGGHLRHCGDCGWHQLRYNSCRDRHCSQCQASARAVWLDAQEHRMLPVPHFQVVFTLPAQLRPIALCNQELVYGAMFDAASAVLRSLAEQRLDLVLGVTMVLHTWTTDLRHHPHLHALVTAGGLRDGAFVATRRPDFLFPHRLVAARFKQALLARLRNAEALGRLLAPDEDLTRLRTALRDAGRRRVRWVIHIEAPEGRNPALAARYLARYARGIAISDQRILAVDDHSVTLRARTGPVTLDGPEFVRRLLLHVLPPGFRKIRHYGLYAPGPAAAVRDRLRRALGADPVHPPASPDDEEPLATALLVTAVPTSCPTCGGALSCQGLPSTDVTLPWLRLPRGPP